ncbi:hypothetical protein [Streptomyces sp. S465]|uniref:hypothetical protein n=1 Tax=Streptomyces sp. S465 TaxID=2979468 RepID=UPI0022A88BA7|nr:hypothetical protein [Streptomyces sp. S465]WAP60511.1 hypothetical protein N6H00_39155 [Streptomyces sp. S465]
MPAQAASPARHCASSSPSVSKTTAATFFTTCPSYSAGSDRARRRRNATACPEVTADTRQGFTLLRLGLLPGSDELFLSWHRSDYDTVRRYDVYLDDTYLGGIYDDVYYVKRFTATSGTIKLVAVGPDGSRSKPSSAWAICSRSVWLSAAPENAGGHHTTAFFTCSALSSRTSVARPPSSLEKYGSSSVPADEGKTEAFLAKES